MSKKSFLNQRATLSTIAIYFIASTSLIEFKPNAYPPGKLSSSVGNKKSNQALNTDSGYAEVNGTRLYYETAGTGEPVVLIHGSFGDRRHWDLQVKQFSKKYKVLRYDVRGYGKSALPNPDAAYADSEDLNALMDFLQIGKAHICGLSMGSIIAIDLALSHPDKCSSLILCGPRVAGDGSAEYRTAYADSVSAGISRAVEIVKKRGAKEGTDSLWTGNNPLSKSVRSSKTQAALLKIGYDYSWWRYLYANKRQQAFPMAIKKINEIKIPTLIVTAEYDLILCQTIADIIAKEIPDAKFVEVTPSAIAVTFPQSCGTL